MIFLIPSDRILRKEVSMWEHVHANVRGARKQERIILRIIIVRKIRLAHKHAAANAKNLDV